MMPGDNRTSTMEYTETDQQPSINSNGSPDGGGAKIWRAGSLLYSRLGLASLFSWLLWGDFSWQMRDRAVVPVAQVLLQKLHASDFYVGLLVSSIPSALGMISGPLISTISDRYRSRLGRRIPFLLIPAPFVALALVGLAFTTNLGEWLNRQMGTQTLGYSEDCLIVFAVLWSIFEIAAITTQFIFVALVNDVVPRELAGRFFGLFRAVSLFAGILFNQFIIGKSSEYYRGIFIVVGAIYGLGLSLMCLKVKEGVYPEPELMPRHSKIDIITPIVTYFRQTFSNSYYLWIYIASMFALLAPGPVNTFSLYYAESIGMSKQEYGHYLAVTYAISFCLSYGLGWLADKLHPLRITMASIGLYAVATFWGGFYATTTPTFIVIFLAHGVLSGCLFTAITPTYQLLFPKKRFGEFYSANSVLIGLASIGLPALMGLLLDRTGHIYRYTFLCSGILGVISFFTFFAVNRNLELHGGAKNYTAPE